MSKLAKYISDLKQKVRHLTTKGKAITSDIVPRANYCDCCGYNSIDKKGSYEICPICRWEDDYTQGESYFLWGGPNSVSLYVAKVNYEKLGASDPRFIKSAIKPTNFKRNPDYVSSAQVLETKWDQLVEAVMADINSNDAEGKALNYYLDRLYETDLSFSREISERIFQIEKLRCLWVKIARLYFTNFTDQTTTEMKNYLLKECHNSWEELQELLNSFAKSS